MRRIVQAVLVAVMLAFCAGPVAFANGTSPLPAFDPGAFPPMGASGPVCKKWYGECKLRCDTRAHQCFEARSQNCGRAYAICTQTCQKRYRGCLKRE